MKMQHETKYIKGAKTWAARLKAPSGLLGFGSTEEEAVDDLQATVDAVEWLLGATE